MDQQGEDLWIQLTHLILMGDRQDQAPDSGDGQSGAATGTQAALLRQRPDVSLIVMVVGGEDVLRQTAQQGLGVVFDEHQRPCLRQPAAGRQNGRRTLCRGQGGVPCKEC